jgi:hypothetical protein
MTWHGAWATRLQEVEWLGLNWCRFILNRDGLGNNRLAGHQQGLFAVRASNPLSGKLRICRNLPLAMRTQNYAWNAHDNSSTNWL